MLIMVCLLIMVYLLDQTCQRKLCSPCIRGGVIVTMIGHYGAFSRGVYHDYGGSW